MKKVPQMKVYLMVLAIAAVAAKNTLNIGVSPQGCKAVFNGREMRCAVGKGGVAAPGTKVEGDGKTPLGNFFVRRGFYRKDRVTPASDFSLHATLESDGWCDDSRSSHYNQPITLPATSCASAEHLWRNDGLYDLAAVIEYNTDPVEPGKGSAIFLHVASESFSPTAGCVALSLSDLEFVLANHIDAIEISSEDATCVPGAQRWVFNTTAANVGDGGGGDGAVFVAADLVFYALEQTTGAVRWKREFAPEEEPREKMPTYYQGQVFVVLGGGKILSLSSTDGSERFSFQTDTTGWSSNPQVDPSSGLVFTYTATTMYAIDTQTGNLVWSRLMNNKEKGTGTTPTVNGGRVYTTDDEGPLALLATTAEVLWATKLDPDEYLSGADSAAVCNSSVVAYVVLGKESNALMGFDKNTGASLWRVVDPDSNPGNAGNSCMHNPTDGDTVYACGIHNLYAVNCATGAPKWAWPSPAPGDQGGLSSPSVTGGVVYFGCDDFSVNAVNASTGESLWRAPTGGFVWSDPFRIGDSVYCGSQDGGFYSWCA